MNYSKLTHIFGHFQKKFQKNFEKNMRTFCKTLQEKLIKFGRKLAENQRQTMTMVENLRLINNKTKTILGNLRKL